MPLHNKRYRYFIDAKKQNEILYDQKLCRQYIKDISHDKYYVLNQQINKKKLKLIEQNQDYYWRNIVFIFLTLLASIFLIVVGIDIYSQRNWGNPSLSLIIIPAFTWLVLNIILHELSHALTLLIYGRKVRRMGFKIKFIFPAFYVDTTDSYLLPKLERVFVYFAGLLMNIILMFILQLFFPEYSYLNSFVFFYVIFNLIPLSLKNDGYHILMTLVSGYDSKENKDRMSIVKIISLTIFLLVIISTIINWFNL